MTDNGCREHCPCVGKTWGTIIDTHRAAVREAREQGAQQERERLRAKLREHGSDHWTYDMVMDLLADPEDDPVAVAEAPYATGGANVPPVKPNPDFYRDTLESEDDR